MEDVRVNTLNGGKKLAAAVGMAALFLALGFIFSLDHQPKSAGVFWFIIAAIAVLAFADVMQHGPARALAPLAPSAARWDAVRIWAMVAAFTAILKWLVNEPNALVFGAFFGGIPAISRYIARQYGPREIRRHFIASLIWLSLMIPAMIAGKHFGWP